MRIHTDAHAARSARALNARAYTTGAHIAFDTGQFAPGRAAGQRLLAHELTHVVQQRRAPRPSRRGDSDRAADPAGAEREAERNAGLLHTPEPLTARRAAPRLARRDRSGPTTVTTTVAEPTGPNACGSDQHRQISAASRQSVTWLRKAVSDLDAYLSDPSADEVAATRAALERHFHATSPAVARRVRDRLELIRLDITRRGDPSNPDPRRRRAFTVECHDRTDRLCQVANAYVPNEHTLVLCPIFFDSFSPLQRATSVVHEMAHALLGLNITDRAYSYDRLLPFLSTAEALDNAESYALFARELGTGDVPGMTAPRDEIDDDCPPETAHRARVALARGERWNRQADTVLRSPLSPDADLLTRHLGDARDATRTAAGDFYKRMERRFHSPMNVRCSDQGCGGRPAYKTDAVGRRGLGAGIGAGAGALLGLVLGGIFLGALGAALFGLLGAGAGALLGLGFGALASSEAAITLCPDWAAQSEGDRIESLLAVAYEIGGKSQRDAQRYAALARAIHDRHDVTPPPAPT